MAEAYPLQWPAGWPRTPLFKRGRNPRYEVSEQKARRDMLSEVGMLADTYSSVTLSTNIPLRRDGLPYANCKDAEDKGVAVYFMRDGKSQVIACDKYDDYRDNYRAIGLAVGGLRAIERAGASELLDRAFEGFKALPAVGLVRHWRQVFDCPNHDPEREELQRKFKSELKKRHPDKGGTDGEVIELNAALAAARLELGIG